MKKLFFLTVALVASLAASAQSENYKPFRFGLGLGYAMPGGDGAKGGILVYGEPSYRITDAIALGLRLELAVMARGTVSTSNNTTNADLDVAANGSYTVNCQYYFSNRGFRPFAGAGLGIYSLASSKVQTNNGNTQTSAVVDAGNKFGFYPRVGFDAGHFTMNVEYNIIPATKNSGNEIKNSYLGIKAGFFISGGRR